VPERAASPRCSMSALTSRSRPRSNPESAGYYGWLASLATLDLPASGALTRQHLGWVPTGPDLLTDLRLTDYDAI
jgi:hypothetical protein